ncbi:cobalamin biosynthesis protein CbiX [Sporosarcina globispora]|uniref:Cobalamin biosynthesis protein CbiX n=1 Tax=Sporosarcina globispora TaxID=1459 RepID=A0A0M0GFQ0_SPOGL|nr:sirohydrochlorin chelatase [Sporosarcina globispora]KON88312.1 cobalamin biosynthesis protein CbiX [Sporosarcina globispora]
MKAVLYIGHGTRSKKGAAEANIFIASVMKKVDAPIQKLCFLELTEPDIEAGFEYCVQEGAEEIVIVPLFLLSAGHIKQDIPEKLAPLIGEYLGTNVRMEDPFGVQDSILDAIAELVTAEAHSVRSDDSLLIVGRGSSDPSILRAFDSIKRGICQRLGVKNVQLCYLAAAAPSFKDGLDSICNEASGRVIVIPYLLFSGLLLSEVIREINKKIKMGCSVKLTDTLGRHGAIQNLVAEKANGEVNVSAAVIH